MISLKISSSSLLDLIINLFLMPCLGTNRLIRKSRTLDQLRNYPQVEDLFPAGKERFRTAKLNQMSSRRLL